MLERLKLENFKALWKADLRCGKVIGSPVRMQIARSGR